MRRTGIANLPLHPGDGIPYPVDKKNMDSSIDMLRNAITQAKIGEQDKLHAIRRLNEFL